MLKCECEYPCSVIPHVEVESLTSKPPRASAAAGHSEARAFPRVTIVSGDSKEAGLESRLSAKFEMTLRSAYGEVDAATKMDLGATQGGLAHMGASLPRGDPPDYEGFSADIYVDEIGRP